MTTADPTENAIARERWIHALTRDEIDALLRLDDAR
mgnify:FL=1